MVFAGLEMINFKIWIFEASRMVDPDSLESSRKYNNHEPHLVVEYFGPFNLTRVTDSNLLLLGESYSYFNDSVVH